MFVYFIKTEAIPPMLKIGKARRPEERLAVLQTGCPYELKLIGTVRCRSDDHALEAERQLHAHFYPERTRGEWFKYTDRVARVVATIVGRPSAETAEILNLPVQGRQGGGVLNKRERWKEYERQRSAVAVAALREMDEQFRRAVDA